MGVAVLAGMARGCGVWVLWCARIKSFFARGRDGAAKLARATSTARFTVPRVSVLMTHNKYPNACAGGFENDAVGKPLQRK